MWAAKTPVRQGLAPRTGFLCALRRTVEEAQPAASAHPGDHDVEGLHVQVRRERARRDAEDQLAQRLALELEVRNREREGDWVFVAGQGLRYGPHACPQRGGVVRGLVLAGDDGHLRCFIFEGLVWSYVM